MLKVLNHPGVSDQGQPDAELVAKAHWHAATATAAANRVEMVSATHDALGQTPVMGLSQHPFSFFFSDGMEFFRPRGIYFRGAVP